MLQGSCYNCRINKPFLVANHVNAIARDSIILT